MSDSKEEGMGIVRRRRSRRLLETRSAASKADGARVTTHSAAAAWGGLLESDRIDEQSRRPSAAPPAVEEEEPTRIIEMQSSSFDQISQPVQGVPAKGRTQIIDPIEDPSASIEERMDAPARMPVAQLRGVPLSNRPGAIAPPDDEARAARISEKPRKRISHQVPQVTPKQPKRPTTKPPQPSAPPTAENVFDLPPDAQVKTAPIQAIEPKHAPEPRRARNPRKIVGIIVLVGLFLGACVWSTAIIFDEMGRSARLNRVADAVDARVARIVEDTPDLAQWVTERDAARLRALSDEQLPLFRETLRATGYAAGVPKVRMLPNSSTGRLVVEVALPDATLALDSEGVWQKGPPGKGFGMALKTNTAPILVGFAIPTLVAIGMLFVGRRRRRAAA